jgi:glycosyltransferase involved in cell wall biosynthesis
MRVHNEVTALSGTARCHVVAPRAKGQPFFETMGEAKVYRYPNIAAESLKSLILEYLISWLFICACVTFITVTKRIKIIHVANPPDFIIPSLAWLKLFAIRFVYDLHDISTETFKAKVTGNSPVCRLIVLLLDTLEALSLNLADLVVATNETILARARAKIPSKFSVVVRTSNRRIYKTTGEIKRRVPDGIVCLGYFGVIANDAAAGLENIFTLARVLESNRQPFKISIVGSGPGLPVIRKLALVAGLIDSVEFHGFVPLPKAFELIEQFDFGVVTWGDLPKNHMHTAMKIMDYMCCGVPVCSLNLREQLNSTSGIGIHGNSFEELGNKIYRVYKDEQRFEDLRRRTLAHFNDVLCWELQEKKLLSGYAALSSG